MSHQETVPPDQQQKRQQADDLEARLPDPEFVPKAKRRQFTAKCNARVGSCRA